jgi:4-amino-4-deoxy-L-arabinose transferase-like glycosyltransferase
VRAAARVAQIPRAWAPLLRTPPAGSKTVVAATGTAVCVGGVGLAFLAQRLLTSAGAVDQGRILFGVASLVALGGIILIDRVAPVFGPAVPRPRLEAWRLGSHRGKAAAGLLAAGFAASLATIPLVEQSGADRTALVVWLAAIVLVVAGAAVGARNPIRMPRLRRERVPELLLVLAILGVALALRLPDLGGIPAFVHGDEAAIGLEGRRILDGGSVFEFGWYGLPSLSYAIASGTLWLFGNDLTGLRAASVIESMLAVLLLYLIVRRLFGRRPALFASFLLAVSQWDIHFSRQGSHYMQAQLATLLVLYFLLRAFDSRRALDYLLCGLSVGLCFEVYYAARLAPAIAGLVLLQRLFDDRGFLRREWLGLLALLLGVIVFLAPMWPAATAQPEVINARFRTVSLLHPDTMRYEMRIQHTGNPLTVVKNNTVRTVEAFNRTGETSLQYGRSGRPLLDFWTAALLPLGFLLVLVRIRGPGYFLLASWIVLTLVFGAILSNQAPFSPRIIALIPALMVLPALVLDAGWRGLTALGGRRVAAAVAVPVAVFLGLSLWTNYHDYFVQFTKHDRPADFNTLLSHYLVKQGHGYRYYLIGFDGPSLRYDTEHFLFPNVDGVDVGAGPLPLPVRPAPRHKPLVFLVEAGAPDERLAAIKYAYPQGVETQHADRLDRPAFTSYVVSHRAAVRATERTR